MRGKGESRRRRDGVVLRRLRDVAVGDRGGFGYILDPLRNE